MSSPLDEWLPPPGSDLHYALLYLPPARRRELAVHEALRGVIARIPATCSSPAIALPKLAWWREEIGALARGTPRHALTQAVGRADKTLVGALLALVDGVESMLGRAAWPDRAARRAAFDAAHGPLWRIHLERCPGGSNPEAVALAVAVEEARVLRDARRHADGGCTLVTAESPDSRDLAPDITLLLRELRAGLAGLPARRRLRSLATLARLALATLEEVQADGSRVFEVRVELTPLRKLWLAWRERWTLG